MRKTVKFTALFLIMTMVFALTGCYFVSPDAEKFEAALQDVLEASPDQIGKATYPKDMSPIPGCVSAIVYRSGTIDCYYYEFSQEKEGQTYFELYYDNFEDLFEDSCFTGEFKNSTSGSRGYVYFDGTIKDSATGYSMFGSGSVYGGAYYQGKVVIVAIARSGSAEYTLHNFLDEINYPAL